MFYCELCVLPQVALWGKGKMCNIFNGQSFFEAYKRQLKSDFAKIANFRALATASCGF